MQCCGPSQTSSVRNADGGCINLDVSHSPGHSHAQKRCDSASWQPSLGIPWQQASSHWSLIFELAIDPVVEMMCVHVYTYL